MTNNLLLVTFIISDRSHFTAHLLDGNVLTLQIVEIEALQEMQREDIREETRIAIVHDIYYFCVRPCGRFSVAGKHNSEGVFALSESGIWKIL